jgi:hypothetical protein
VENPPLRGTGASAPGFSEGTARARRALALPAAERRRLLDELYARVLLRPVPPADAGPPPEARPPGGNAGG